MDKLIASAEWPPGRPLVDESRETNAAFIAMWHDVWWEIVDVLGADPQTIIDDRREEQRT